MGECSGDLKECIESIQRVLPDFQFNQSTEREFCELLSDGEILCSLLEELSEGRIVYESSHSHVFASKNIQFFLSQCRNMFGPEDSELFDPDDLLTMTNPEKVVRTVLKLARKLSVTAKPNTRNSGLMENVIKEICDLEQALIAKLEVLLVYESELLGLLSEWSDELVLFVFRYIRQLCDLHRELSARLTRLAEQGCEQFCQNLGALFKEMEPKLSVYITYLCHLRGAHYRMEKEFRKAPELFSQVQLLDRRFQGPGFFSLYDAPIRQTTNYLQLLKRLYKTALKEIPEVADSLDSLIQHWDAFLSRTNASKKEADSLVDTQIVLDLVTQLPVCLANPETVGLHLADELFKVRTAGMPDRKPDAAISLCVLTTKQLIIAAKSNRQESQATYSFSIPIVSSLQVRKSGGSVEITWGETGEKVTLEESKSKSKCLENFKKLLDEVKATNFPPGWNRNGHCFVLATLPKQTTCTACKKPLPGVVMQGYSCSHCNKKLDLPCLQQLCNRRGSLPDMSVAPHRFAAEKFYHRHLSREKAEQILQVRPVGSFLLRDSSIGGMALSLRCDRTVEHFNIMTVGRKYALGNSVFLLNSLDDLLDYYTKNKLSIHFSGIKCSLTNGVVANNVIKVLPPHRSLIEEM